MSWVRVGTAGLCHRPPNPPPPHTHSICRCYHAQPSPRWSEANLPTPLCRILGIAAHRDAVMCHLALGPTGQELSLTSPLKLVCHWEPRQAQSLRATCVHSPRDEDRPEGDLPTPFGEASPASSPSIGSQRRLAPRTTQLQIKDCLFGPQPTDHSVPPRPITNNYKLRNSMGSKRDKARKILKGITVKADKELLEVTVKTGGLCTFVFMQKQAVTKVKLNAICLI